MATRVCNPALVLMRGRRYPRHSLHNIEHRTLDLQQTQFLAIHLKGYVSRLHMIAVVQELLETAFGVEIVNDLFRNLYTGQHTRILDNQLLATHLGSRNTTERGVITVTNIFLKPDSDQLTKFFFFHKFPNFGHKITLFFAHMQIFY